MKTKEAIVSSDQGELFGLTEIQIAELNKRFELFRSTFVKNWPAYLHSDSLNEKKTKDWRELIGVIAPQQLPEKGIGQTFLAVWENLGTSYSGNERRPMKIWLSKGIENIDSSLRVDFLELGTLVQGKENVQMNYDVPTIRKNRIYYISPVILRPSP